MMFGPVDCQTVSVLITLFCTSGRKPRTDSREDRQLSQPMGGPSREGLGLSRKSAARSMTKTNYQNDGIYQVELRTWWTKSISDQAEKGATCSRSGRSGNAAKNVQLLIGRGCIIE